MNNEKNDAIIRPMVQLDVVQVLELEHAGHAFPWSEQIFRDCIDVGYTCSVMLKDHQMVAFSVMSMAAGEAHILNVTVSPHTRRQGFGRQMMHFLIDKARRNHNFRALLEVRMSNSPAIALYKGLGFYLVSVRKDYYPDENGREDALVLGIDL